MTYEPLMVEPAGVPRGRAMVERADWAARAYAKYDVATVNRIVDAAASALAARAQEFARDAVAETGFGVSQILSPMVAHDGVHMCHARHDAFRAAAEPCEEMRLDETRDDADIGFHTLSINPSWNTGSCCSEGNTRVVVEGFMVENPPVRHHFGREQLLEFFSGAGSVGAQLAEQGDLISLHSGLFQIGKKPRNQSFVGRGPSDVCE